MYECRGDVRSRRWRTDRRWSSSASRCNPSRRTPRSRSSATCALPGVAARPVGADGTVPGTTCRNALAMFARGQRVHAVAGGIRRRHHLVLRVQHADAHVAVQRIHRIAERHRPLRGAGVRGRDRDGRRRPERILARARHRAHVHAVAHDERARDPRSARRDPATACDHGRLVQDRARSRYPTRCRWSRADSP